MAKLGMIHQISGEDQGAHAAFERSFVLWQQAATTRSLHGSSLPPAPHPLRFPANEPGRLCPITVQDGATLRTLQHLFRGLNRYSPLSESIALPDVAHRMGSIGRRAALLVPAAPRRQVERRRQGVRWRFRGGMAPPARFQRWINHGPGAGRYPRRTRI